MEAYMKTPILMPEPNYFRYKKGYFIIKSDGKIFISSEVNNMYPDFNCVINDNLCVNLTSIQDEENCRIFVETALNNDIENINRHFNTAFKLDELSDEFYSIICENNRLRIVAKDRRGFYYAIQTLKQMITRYSDDGTATLKSAEIFDFPHVSIRGVHIYLPAQEDIEYFQKFVKGLANLKYNRIYVEVSGMEYKKHPEINESWIKYSEDMNEFPEKAKLYQNSFKYMKDSIHVENAGGKFLKQEIVKKLVRFCKDNMLEVVPEVQSLSHCDYLVIPHREIAERPYDPYPDTYCPMNPKSYELLFDVIDEVVEVFEPATVSIGHDEWYSYCECDKCKDWDPADLFAYDVTKIHAYLASKGVKTDMFGEKLLNAYTPDGRGQGGAFKVIESYEVSKIFGFRGATFPAIKKIPKDITLLQWYWGIEPTGFEQYSENGLKGVYANFMGPNVPNWEKYSRMDNVKGAACSHWDTLEQDNMARDGYMFNIIYSSYVFWNETYNNNSYEKVRNLAIEFSQYYLQILNGKCLPSLSKRDKDTASVVVRHEQKEKYYMGTSAVEVRNFLHTHVEHTAGTYKSKISRYTVPQTFRVGVVNDKADSVIFTHNTDAVIPFRLADHGYKIEDYLIGTYKVNYEDGTTEPVLLYFGKHIGNDNTDWGRKVESVCSYSTDIYLQQVSYFAKPHLICENGKGSQTVYDYEWINPYPDKKIMDIVLSANKLNKPFSIFVYDIECIKLM
jgi:hexosaminidase